MILDYTSSECCHNCGASRQRPGRCDCDDPAPGREAMVGMIVAPVDFKMPVRDCSRCDVYILSCLIEYIDGASDSSLDVAIVS